MKFSDFGLERTLHLMSKNGGYLFTETAHGLKTVERFGNMYVLTLGNTVVDRTRDIKQVMAFLEEA